MNYPLVPSKRSMLDRMGPVCRWTRSHQSSF
jgi:hypothetical protein